MLAGTHLVVFCHSNTFVSMLHKPNDDLSLCFSPPLSPCLLVALHKICFRNNSTLHDVPAQEWEMETVSQKEVACSRGIQIVCHQLFRFIIHEHQRWWYSPCQLNSIRLKTRKVDNSPGSYFVMFV